jgi:hypothetical protein
MIEMRMGEQDLVNEVNAVTVLELQQRRHHAHAHVDQGMTDDPAVLPLDERVGHVGLPVGIARSTFVGARALQAELDPEGGLDAVDSQQKLCAYFVHFAT